MGVVKLTDELDCKERLDNHSEILQEYRLEIIKLSEQIKELQKKDKEQDEYIHWRPSL